MSDEGEKGKGEIGVDYKSVEEVFFKAALFGKMLELLFGGHNIEFTIKSERGKFLEARLSIKVGETHEEKEVAS